MNNEINYLFIDDKMFLFRRLSENYSDLKFKTGNKGFDEINPDGSLNPYLNEDIARGGEYCTYILIEEIDTENLIILGLLRFRLTNKEKFFSELESYELEKEIKTNLINQLNKTEYLIIYLSRIGVKKEYQDMNIGQIISNFFEFLVKRKRERLFIYIKVIDEHKDFIAPTYEFLAKNDDKQWGRYYLVSKFLEFNE